MQNADGQVLLRAELDTASVTDGIAKMKTALEELKTYAGRQFSLIRSQAQKEGNASVSWIPGLASRLINALTLGINGGGTRIGNALRGVLVSAMSAGSEYSSRFSGIGADVISGIIRGIQGTASSLWNTLRAVASNMLSTLKHALGIQSPSRVMREEIGRQIGAGIAGGSKFVAYFKAIYFVYGMAMTIVPMLAGYLFAKYVLKFNLLNALGSITGGMTSTPALGTLINVSGSDNVASAYAATYPIALIAVVLVSQFLVILF